MDISQWRCNRTKKLSPNCGIKKRYMITISWEPIWLMNAGLIRTPRDGDKGIGRPD
jgi:hypothetical protein